MLISGKCDEFWWITQPLHNIDSLQLDMLEWNCDFSLAGKSHRYRCALRGAESNDIYVRLTRNRKINFDNTNFKN
jgi:hypothetical protein